MRGGWQGQGSLGVRECSSTEHASAAESPPLVAGLVPGLSGFLGWEGPAIRSADPAPLQDISVLGESGPGVARREGTASRHFHSRAWGRKPADMAQGKCPAPPAHSPDLRPSPWPPRLPRSWCPLLPSLSPTVPAWKPPSGLLSACPQPRQAPTTQHSHPRPSST